VCKGWRNGFASGMPGIELTVHRDAEQWWVATQGLPCLGGWGWVVRHEALRVTGCTLVESGSPTAHVPMATNSLLLCGPFGKNHPFPD
jgi:hypothetical protein